ncbi:MAG: carbon-nitrogen hydrolase family protein [Thaumarchaeota archaeon]|nr:carbon-nitrogen hydrolase family protein [Nitrososphaerota archaeon]
MARVAVVQMRADTEKEKNLGRILRYIKDASRRKSKLCAFPEFMMFYTGCGQSAGDLSALAEKISGEFVTSISEAARENSIQVVGTFYEKSPRRNRVYDTSFLIDKDGRVASKYRKIHLYDALGFKESQKLQPGSSLPRPVRSAVGRMGMMICYDLRFPEMSRMLASSGSEVLVVPSAWVRGPMKEEHWVTINKARAIENGCYVVAPDQVGNIYCGRSLVVDPFGRVLLDMKKREGIGIADLSLDRVRSVRQKLPLLKNRRTDLYADLRA